MNENINEASSFKNDMKKVIRMTLSMISACILFMIIMLGFEYVNYLEVEPYYNRMENYMNSNFNYSFEVKEGKGNEDIVEVYIENKGGVGLTLNYSKLIFYKKINVDETISKTSKFAEVYFRESDNPEDNQIYVEGQSSVKIKVKVPKELINDSDNIDVNWDYIGFDIYDDHGQTAVATKEVLDRNTITLGSVD